ncbi:MAG: hypothetical protein Q7J27_04630 [Syntrophales bacterium]|nr:hypothetical protein [Syntrophales bacterium]
MDEEKVEVTKEDIKYVEVMTMKKDILRAIKEFTPLYDEVTTSDLQGICEARAWKIIQEKEPREKFDACFWERMRISDQILTGIYEREV